MVALWVLLARQWLHSDNERLLQIRVRAIDRLLEVANSRTDRALTQIALGDARAFPEWRRVLEQLPKRADRKALTIAILSEMFAMPGRKTTAAFYLRKISDPAAVDLLLEALDDSDANVSFQAAASLLEIGDRSVAPRLAAWRRQRWEFLETLKHDAMPHITRGRVLQWLVDCAAEGSLAIATIADLLSEERRQDELFTLLRIADEHPERGLDVTRVIQALESFPLSVYGPIVRELVRAASGPNRNACRGLVGATCREVVRSRLELGQHNLALLDALARLDRDEALGLMRKRVDQRAFRESERLEAAVWLATQGDRSVLEFLRQTFDAVISEYEDVLGRKVELQIAADQKLRGGLLAAVNGLGRLADSECVSTVAAALVKLRQLKFLNPPLDGLIDFVLCVNDASPIDLGTLQQMADIPDDGYSVKTGTQSYLEYVAGIGDVGRTEDVYEQVKVSREKIRRFASQEIARRMSL